MNSLSTPAAARPATQPGIQTEQPERTGTSDPAIPLVTVITVCLNSEQTIRGTIESVLAQTYPRIEYIIIDGVSKDSTLDIIGEYRDRIATVVSEKDEGISDAFNKGLSRAHGEFIQILNADDRFDPDKIQESVKILLEHPDAAFVFGDILSYASDGSVKMVEGDRNYERVIGLTMTRMNHPTMLVRKSVYDQFGGFDKRWRQAMDYDWILRIHRGGLRGIYSPKIIVRMNGGGASDRNRIKAFREVRDISIRHGQKLFIAYSYFVLRCIKHALFLILGKR